MENNKQKNSIKIKIFIIVLLLLIIAFLAGGYFIINMQNENSSNVSIKAESTNLNVEYSEEELTGEWKDYVAKITLSDSGVNIEGKNVTISGNTITIESSGTYYITGNLSDGNIVIEATKDDNVQLVLDNCSVTSSLTAPINAVKCNELTITLKEGSINTITDSNNYTTFTDTEKSEPDSAIFSKSDLIINGTGKLVINANYKVAIASKDGLKIINAEIEINSEDDGIRGKDYVAINNANITINSKGDGIKSTNDEDTSLGYIKIENSKITINSEADGIQAETILNISEDSKINITTSGTISSSNNQGFFGKTTSSSSSNSGSSKGLKAGTEITIESGTIEISSTDDSIHSNGIVIINGGTLKLSSSDDGIHADTNIVINDGNIDITKSYEGIESSYIEINDGIISVVASDDGVNVAGGNDSSSMDGRIGQNSFSNVSSSNRKLVINGGSIKVNSAGDGLDSNGSMYINGGTIIVAGPASSGNGALDYDSECVITGGNLIVYGSTGMWQNPSNNSTQYTLAFQTSGKAGDVIVLKDSSGNEIASFTAEKAYAAIAISNSKIEKGKTYTLYINNSSVGSLEVSNIVTSNSSSLNGNGMGEGMMPQGNPGVNNGVNGQGGQNKQNKGNKPGNF